MHVFFARFGRVWFMKRHILKPKIINLMRNADLSMYGASEVVGIAPSTVFRWRRADGEFRRQIEAERIRQRTMRELSRAGAVIDRIRASFTRYDDAEIE